jgi:hypothetical protein
MRAPRAWARGAMLGVGALLPVLAWAQDPRGTVPPPVPAAPPAVSPRETGVSMPPPPPDFQETVAAVIGRFEPSYVSKGSPRLALYWNRQLSDRLSQWDSQDRTLTTDRRVAITQGPDAGPGKAGGREFQESETANVTQRMGAEARRAGPDEPWQWEFQSGFLDPFMRAGARIIDRTAILRLTAARASNSLGRPQILDSQPIEMDALLGHAELFVEILLSPSARAPGGQEFVAVVKDVKSGQVLAHVNSRNAAYPLDATRSWVATSRGFEPHDTPPPLHDVASNLAINVMDALTKFWNRKRP